MKIDREPAAWQEQKIQFYLDGTMYHQVTGAQVGNLEDWTILAHTPIYITLNVAVGGGGYAGPTDGNTGTYTLVLCVPMSDEEEHWRRL